MIIGIDEVGNFDPNSDDYNYFIAVILDQNKNKYDLKKQQFLEWEKSIKKKHNSEKELKGQKMSNIELIEFYNSVLAPEPTILYSAVRIKPSQNSKESIEKIQNGDIEIVEKALEHYKEISYPDWVKWYERIFRWYKNRKAPHILKMKSLQYLLGISFNRGIAWAQVSFLLDKDITNIKNFTFKIDKDFIRAKNVRTMWNEIFRIHWITRIKWCQ